MSLRVVVTASREWEDRDLLEVTCSNLVIEAEGLIKWAVGDCPNGGDKLFTAWHEDIYLCKPKIYYADWDHYGRRAGPIRNREMLTDFRPDMVLAFPWRGAKNRGTLGTAALARELLGLEAVFTWGGPDNMGLSRGLQEAIDKD